MIITTLPISYRHGRSLKIFTTILTANVLAKLTGYKLILPINLLGLSRSTSLQDEGVVIGDFVKDLVLVGITIPRENIRTDLEYGFRNFVLKSLKTKSIEHQIQLARCPCGIVELPPVALEEINSQGRGNNFTGNTCKRCNQPSEIISTNGLTIAFLPESNVICQPQIQANRLSVVYKEVTRHPLIITKQRIPDEYNLEHNGHVIDPDCAVGLYPYFLAQEFQIREIGLVVGFTTLPQVSRALAISSSLFPEIRLKLFVHPGIKFNPEDPLLPRTPFVEYNGDHQLKDWAIALMLCLQQTRLESVFCKSDLIVAKNTRTAYRTQKKVISNYVAFDTAVKLFHRINVTQTYRKIRQKVTLSSIEQLLAHATL